MLKCTCNSTTNTRTKYLLVMHKTLCSVWLTQCLQVYGFIRILYEIIAANTENKIENAGKIAGAVCVLAAILYRKKHKIRICTPKVLKFWVEITD